MIDFGDLDYTVFSIVNRCDLFCGRMLGLYIVFSFLFPDDGFAGLFLCAQIVEWNYSTKSGSPAYPLYSSYCLIFFQNHHS